MQASWLACAIRNRLEEIAEEEGSRPIVVQMLTLPVKVAGCILAYGIEIVGGGSSNG